MVSFAVQRHVRELYASRKQRFALRPGVCLLGRALRFVSGIGEREDDRPFIQPAHGLDNTLVERATLGADADQDRRLQGLNRFHKIFRRRRLVRIYLLRFREIGARWLQQPVDVEHEDAAARFILGQSLVLQGYGDQLGDTYPSRAGAQEQDALVGQRSIDDLQRRRESRQRDTGRPLDVIVVTQDLVGVAVEQSNRIGALPVLEVNAAIREYLLHRLDEFFDEFVQLFIGRWLLT